MNQIIVELSDERVRTIPVVDTNEDLVDIREAGFLKYGEAPESPETLPYYCFLRESPLSKLEKAQSNLPNGLSFRVYEGYRHPEFQQKLFHEQLERTTVSNTGWDEAKCFRETAKLVSPLQTWDGLKIIPPHSTGGAVDIEVVNAKGQVIDFGMEVKDWYQVDPSFCQSSFPGLKKAAKENRDMLVEVLEAEGFVNYPREWWHFSYGDQYWAYLKGKKNAIYDCVELP